MTETSNQHSGQDHTGQKTVRVRASELIGRSWLNTGEKSLDLQALRGKIVILDTLCCINCLHVLDELRPSSTCRQLMQHRVQKSRITILPRRACKSRLFSPVLSQDRPVSSLARTRTVFCPV